MAGVTTRKCADGAWRIWYIDREGRQKFAKATGNKRESLLWAKALELRERGVELGIYVEESPEEMHRDDPFDEIAAAYIAWGEAQGGLIGGSWSPVHAAEKRAKLKYWKESLHLETLGDLQGKLPVAEACLRDLKRGRTNKTLNGYVDALKSLCTWCVDRDFLEENPFRRLRFFDARPQVERRALTVEEVARLLEAAPPDRRILYELALLSGLRANETRQLTLSHLDQKHGGIWLVAEWTKGRRDCLQPLPGWFLAHLQVYGSQKIAATLYDKHRSGRLNVPADPLFFVPHHTARSLAIDLRAAGIEKSTPEGKIDFHALRTTFSTLLDDVGATEKTKEVLLRHAPATLAHKRYVKVRSGRPNEAVDQVAQLLGLAHLYANSMPTPQKTAVGQNAQLLVCQTFRSGSGVVGAPGVEPDAVGRVDVDALHLALQPLTFRERGHHLQAVAEDHAVLPIPVVLVELGAVGALGQAVEVGEHVDLIARGLPAVARLARQVVDQRLGLDFLLDVQGRHVDHQVVEVLVVLTAPDELGVQVAIAPLVGLAERRFLLVTDQRLVLGRGDIRAAVLLVAQGLDLLAGPGAAASLSGHGHFPPAMGEKGLSRLTPKPWTC